MERMFGKAYEIEEEGDELLATTTVFDSISIPKISCNSMYGIGYN